jgi:endogenous inhibitor of DNA gyrase (YacG/DUF329 family)
MDDAATTRVTRPCPICGKPAGTEFRPFCSSRCRLIDLGRWIDGTYRVPTLEGPDDEAPSPPQDGDP